MACAVVDVRAIVDCADANPRLKVLPIARLHRRSGIELETDGRLSPSIDQIDLRASFGELTARSHCFLACVERELESCLQHGQHSQVIPHRSRYWASLRSWTSATTLQALITGSTLVVERVRSLASRSRVR